MGPASQPPPKRRRADCARVSVAGFSAGVPSFLEQRAENLASVRVVLRFRPDTLPAEGIIALSAGGSDKGPNQVNLLRNRGTSHSFVFDHVFNCACTNEQLFLGSAVAAVESACQGQDGSVIAYGQSKACNVSVIEGDLQDREAWGVIPRAAALLFKKLQGEDAKVTATCLDVHTEEIRDLLTDSGDPDLKPVEMRHDAALNVRGHSELPVMDAEEVVALLERAAGQRTEASSTAHSIFTLKVVREVNGEQRIGRLHLVHLAGTLAERPSNGRGKHGEVPRCSKSMSTSLFTLARVLSSIQTGAARAPYRDSKLTRVLQEALSRRSSVCLLASAPMGLPDAEETLRVLNYANEVKKARARPAAASRSSFAQPLALTAPARRCPTPGHREVSPPQVDSDVIVVEGDTERTALMAELETAKREGALQAERAERYKSDSERLVQQLEQAECRGLEQSRRNDELESKIKDLATLLAQEQQARAATEELLSSVRAEVVSVAESTAQLHRALQHAEQAREDAEARAAAAVADRLRVSDDLNDALHLLRVGHEGDPTRPETPTRGRRILQDTTNMGQEQRCAKVQQLLQKYTVTEHPTSCLRKSSRGLRVQFKEDVLAEALSPPSPLYRARDAKDYVWDTAPDPAQRMAALAAETPSPVCPSQSPTTVAPGTQSKQGTPIGVNKEPAKKRISPHSGRRLSGSFPKSWVR